MIRELREQTKLKDQQYLEMNDAYLKEINELKAKAIDHQALAK